MQLSKRRQGASDFTWSRSHTAPANELRANITAFDDYLTIIRSPSYARLAEKVQVDVGPGLSNRQTHTTRVEANSVLVAKSLRARHPEEIAALGGVNVLVTRNSALLHDMGHQLFGHAGEDALHELALLAGIDGFNANAQSFRIATAGEMVLSPMTLCASLKYPWVRGGNPASPDKFGVFDEDVAKFHRVRAVLRPHHLTLEAEIMDKSDDFAYVIDDMLDFFRDSRLPLHLIAIGARTDSGIRADMSDEALRFLERTAARIPEIADRRSDFESALANALQLFPLAAPYGHTAVEDRQLENFRRVLTKYFAECVRVREDGGTANTHLYLPEPVRDELTILKELTWDYVILRTELQEKRAAQRASLRRKGEALLDAAHSRRGRLFESLPEHLRTALSRAECVSAASRSVIDFLASLSGPELGRIAK